MFWIYIAVASASAVGVVNTLIGIVLTVVSYGLINTALSRYAARTGLSVSLFSRTLFGVVGSALASLIFATTAIYYAVFEGSIIAVAFQQFFGGNIVMWYAIVVLYAAPLAIGGVRNWLDRLNGFLLPLYFGGLIAVVIAATVIRGVPTHWIGESAAPGALPGWLSSYLIYMGVYIMMMYTFDYARLAKQADKRFHSSFTFGWVFYLFTFGLSGLVGIYIMSAWGLEASETGVVQAFISSLGFIGVLVIFISQTRINTANYYLASSNLEALGLRLAIRWPRYVWAIIAGVIVFLLMLTDVLSYLLKALAWQGVFVTAWVAIALVYLLLTKGQQARLPEVRIAKLPALNAGAVAWLVAAAAGILLTEQTLVPLLAQLAPLITVVLAAGLYYLAFKIQRPPMVTEAELSENEKAQLAADAALS